MSIRRVVAGMALPCAKKESVLWRTSCEIRATLRPPAFHQRKHWKKASCRRIQSPRPTPRSRRFRIAAPTLANASLNASAKSDPARANAMSEPYAAARPGALAIRPPAQVAPGEEQRVARCQPIAARLAKSRAKAAESLVIGKRLRHVAALPAGHPAPEAKVEVLDPAREVERVVSPERKELAPINRQHRSGRGGQVGTDCQRLVARHAAQALNQAVPAADPGPHALVSAGRRRSSTGGR